MDNKFKIQEDEYVKPYHHLVSHKDCSSFDFLHWGLEYYGYTRRVIEQVKMLEPASICEVGCGDGKISLELAKQLPDTKVDGYDLAKQAISFAQAYGMYQDNLQFHHSDLNESQEKYDCIIAVEVFEHISDEIMEQFVQTISSKLKEGGKLVITVPSKFKPLHENPKHYRHYDHDQLLENISPHFKIDTFGFIHNGKKLGCRFIRKLLINRFFLLNFSPLRRRMFKTYYEKYSTIDKSYGTHVFAICSLTQK